MTLPAPRFTGIFIPTEILAREDLSPLEQMLISWVDALYCPEHGGCFASNAYLADRLRVQENTIAKAITHLRQIGLIEDISFNGRSRVLKAKIAEYVDKCQSKAGLDLNPRQGWRKIQGRVGEKSNPSYIESKEESKVYIPPTPKGVELPIGSGKKNLSSSSEKPKKPVVTSVLKEKFMDNVFITKEEHTKLVETHGEPAVTYMIEILNAYIGSSGKTYKSHYHTMIKGGWVYKRYLDDQAKGAVKTPGVYQRQGKLVIEADKRALETSKGIQEWKIDPKDHMTDEEIDAKLAKMRKEVEERRTKR